MHDFLWYVCNLPPVEMFVFNHCLVRHDLVCCVGHAWICHNSRWEAKFIQF